MLALTITYYYINYECKASLSEGCSEVDNNTGLCTQCIEGLSFDSKTKSCICKNGLNHCKLCSKDSSYCEICKTGYFNSNKGCKCSVFHGCKKCINNICVKT